jgi:hypothetical protein
MSFLIDPNDVIDFNRSDSDLELFWLFCGVVAGKTAKTQARLLDNFLTDLVPPHGRINDTPFGRIHRALKQGKLLDKIIESRLGQFNRLHGFMRDSLLLDLKNCSVSDLEAVHGCGPKTARMFLMFTRPNQKFAALDTHVLKFLATKGHEVPKATPPAGPRYRALEKEFVKLAEEAKMTVADFDLMIWKSYAK